MGGAQSLVVRREGESLRRYVHIATGNYNPTTSRVYTDIGIFTADPLFGEDATNLFNYLTGYSRYSKYHCLLVAPVKDPRLKKFLKEVLLDAYLRDTVKARALRADGTYARVEPRQGEEPFNVQDSALWTADNTPTLKV